MKTKTFDSEEELYKFLDETPTSRIFYIQGVDKGFIVGYEEKK